MTVRKHNMRARKFDIAFRRGGRCKWCDVVMVRAPHPRPPGRRPPPNEATIDHAKPLSRGGKDRWENWQVICRTCNIAKADKYNETPRIPAVWGAQP